MKKLLTVAVAALLIMGLAAATYAMEMKASGFIRVRTAWYVNTGDPGTIRATSDNFDDGNAWMDSRMRLKLDFIASEDLMGVIYFEGDSTRWGEASGTRNAAGYWGTDRSAVELKQFYIDFKVPGIADFAPNRLRAGLQALSLRSHVWCYVDGAGLRWQIDTGPVRHYFNWFKPWEGTDYQYDDSDLYVWRGILSLPDFPVRPGGFFAYLNSNDDPLGAGLALLAPGITDSLFDGEYYWIGVNVDGKVGPVNLQTDFIYFGGTAEPTSLAKNLALPALIDDADFGGWLAWADVNANLDVGMPGLNVGGTFMYATGNDLSEFNKPSPDLDAYYVPPGSEANTKLSIVFWPSNVHDGINLSRGAGRSSGTTVQQRMYGGLWTIKGYASVKPLDWLKVTGYGMYIGDTTDDGNTVGNAVDITEVTGLRDDDDIGFEFGAIADISIYKNLTYSIGAGWLLAGDALDTVGPLGTNEEPDDPWAIVSQLMYKF
jgi:hypothetical protein